MTEENNTNMVAASLSEPEISATKISPASEQVQVTNNEEAHKPSNLRRRWKRKTGTATIKEDETTGPRELKTIKIKSVENLKKSTEDFRKTCDGYSKCGVKEHSHSKGYDEHCENSQHLSCKGSSICECRQQKPCYCRCFFGKIKHFMLKLFGFEPEQPQKKSKRYLGNGKRNNYPRRRSSRSNSNYRSS